MEVMKMCDEFINKLEKDEKILFHEFSDISKTSKQYCRFLLGFALLLLFWILAINGIRNEGILKFKILVIFGILCILTICLLYGLIYNLLLKYKKKNNEYFVTNKRIALYNSKNGLRIENISNIEHIGIAREKNNYGDISFSFYANNLIEQMKNGMSFEGVKNPRGIVATICKINNKIHIYDDRPTVMGKKLS